MLTRLVIENFALIERADIEFGPGLNVITGETGAGKSILLGALNCILGEPAQSDLIRSGCDLCVVEGLFEFASDVTGQAAIGRLGLMDVEVDDGQVVLRREIRDSGRSRAFLDGRVVPVKRLKEIGNALVDLHGQHEHQSLLDEEQHVRFLDDCAQLGEHSDTVHEAFVDVQAATTTLKNLERERTERMREQELRTFQLEEIERIAPEPGEDERLENEVRVLTNQAELASEVEQVFERLYRGDGATVEVLGACRRQLERIVDIDTRLSYLTQEIDQLLYRAEDVATEFKNYLDELEADPDRLEQARDRLFELRRLIQKHGGNFEEFSHAACKLKVSADRLAELSDEISVAQRQYKEVARRFAEACLELSRRREMAAIALSGEVERGLAALGINGASFQVACNRDEDPNGLVEINGVRYRADERGIERVAFCISTNAGEPTRPLARVASGGEISRIMLVLKAVVADHDVVSTLVFDEIDSGISGHTASTVGHRLQQLGRSHQTIAITHLPQIACLADYHFSVRKSEHSGRTVTEVYPLMDSDDRRDEVASLLAGESLSQSAQQHAEELLK